MGLAQFAKRAFLGLLMISSIVFTGAYAHANMTQTNSAMANCQSSCTSHAQLLATNSQTKHDENDEKEPSPPLFSWIKQATDLSLLYGTFVFTAYWIFSKSRKVHLTTQLRF
jgi:hypothetical protein